MREDYSSHGTAWDYLTHDLARSKAYRWGEDGIAGLCDRYQILVFAMAFWNGRDPIVKERLFGLNSSEGNHGEDVKEYYYYLDNTPSHSYQKMLYKYPQREFPYGWLVEENRRRGGRGPEFELIDTGIFDDDRYFDIFVEYAKASEEDICIRIEAFNRGPEAAHLHLLPHLWFRNSWAWGDPPGPEPSIVLGESSGYLDLQADDRSAQPPQNLREIYQLGLRHLYADGRGTPLFTFNETNAPRVYGPGNLSRKRYMKDAFHRYIVNGEYDQVNPLHEGTKACIDYKLHIPAGQSAVLRLRLIGTDQLSDPLATVDRIVEQRCARRDLFCGAVHPPNATERGAA